MTGRSVGPTRLDPAARPAGTARADAGTRPAFLPERGRPDRLRRGLPAPARAPAAAHALAGPGGLKGGRRSVKRGQTVEFADYRDYTLGDDLRQLDWNVYARLEKLFVKLFVEEEDVTITLLVDASASMAYGHPEQAAVREAGRGRARLHRARQRGPRRASRALSGRIARRRTALRGSGRVFRLLADLSAIEPADGPTDLLAAARHAAAQLHGRGVVVLISDLLDPSADRVIRELAATGSELIVLHVLSPDELDPPLEGDLRLVDTRDRRGHRRHRRPGDRSTPTRRGSRRGRPASPTSRRSDGRATSTCSSDAEPRRPDVRRAAPPPGPGLTDAVHRARSRSPACCSSRRSSRCTCSSCGATRRWSRRRCCGAAARPTSRPTRRGSGCAGACCCCSSCCSSSIAGAARGAAVPRAAGRASPGDIVLVVDTSASMAATDVAPNRLAAAQDAADRRPPGPPDRRQGQRHRRGPDGTDRGQRDDRPRPRPPGDRRPSTGDRRRGDLGDALELASKLAARSGEAEILVATDAALATRAGRRASTRPSGSCTVGRDRRNQAIVALAVRTAPSAVTRSVFVSIANLDLERGAAPARGLGRRPAARGARRARSMRRPAPTSSSTTSRTTSATVEVRLVGARSGRRPAPRPAGRRRPTPGPIIPPIATAAHPGGRRGRPVPRDRALVPAQRRAVRRRAGGLRRRDRAHRRTAVGPHRSSRASCRRPCRRRPILAIAPPRTSPLGHGQRAR